MAIEDIAFAVNSTLMDSDTFKPLDQIILNKPVTASYKNTGIIFTNPFPNCGTELSVYSSNGQKYYDVDSFIFNGYMWLALFGSNTGSISYYFIAPISDSAYGLLSASLSDPLEGITHTGYNYNNLVIQHFTFKKSLYVAIRDAQTNHMTIKRLNTNTNDWIIYHETNESGICSSNVGRSCVEYNGILFSVGDSNGDIPTLYASRDAKTFTDLKLPCIGVFMLSNSLIAATPDTNTNLVHLKKCIDSNLVFSNISWSNDNWTTLCTIKNTMLKRKTINPKYDIFKGIMFNKKICLYSVRRSLNHLNPDPNDEKPNFCNFAYSINSDGTWSYADNSSTILSKLKSIIPEKKGVMYINSSDGSLYGVSSYIGSTLKTTSANTFSVEGGLAHYSIHKLCLPKGCILYLENGIAVNQKLITNETSKYEILKDGVVEVHCNETDGKDLDYFVL